MQILWRSVTGQSNIVKCWLSPGLTAIGRASVSVASERMA